MITVRITNVRNLVKVLGAAILYSHYCTSCEKMLFRYSDDEFPTIVCGRCYGPVIDVKQLVEKISVRIKYHNNGSCYMGGK